MTKDDVAIALDRWVRMHEAKAEEHGIASDEATDSAVGRPHAIAAHSHHMKALHAQAFVSFLYEQFPGVPNA